ncbi:phage coat protein [Pseudomonas guariconensis]|uniref:phage coat protein n=1 Tax=Pseudomonas TaxID=286 RepID=UPI002097355D|nr:MULTISPECIES: phage coat protein [Pseudomonas]MCO7640748.1 phage coat protein [Pseudomonas sp. S 311-6]MCO7515717.1 phage coat protein [Pseudomonas putida]MCO7566442.1 phage coat protein [Pseudomonas mosselii]MCO7595054.1 phage coat protein [Pseudomonas guariconensis]MCO7605690.1 phage coat protein [Pseudomonas guariconensis]
MATTQLSDIFVRDYYGALAPVNSPEKTAVFESGIVTRSPTLDNIANNGQGTSEIAYWQDLDADEEPNISNDDPDDLGEVGKAEQGSMRARTLFLNKGYGVADLSAELANSEPMQHIRNRFGTYWTRRWQRYLLGAARGIIASNVANDDGDMVIDSGATISAEAFQDAAFTAGDAADMFGAIGVHSVVMNQMVKQDLIEYLRDSTGKIILATYLGKPVFMDDSLTYASGQYLSVFFGQGAFGYGEGTPHVPVELQRKPDGGNGGGAEVLWERKTFILQPAGFSWVGSNNLNLSPTAAQYANAANWERVFDRKQVPFAAVISG